MKLEFPKRKKVFKKGGSVGNPNIYWNLILLFVFVFFVFHVVAGYLLFRGVNAKTSLPANDSATDAALPPRERIENALQYFREKENKSNQTINSPSPIIDPSL